LGEGKSVLLHNSRRSYRFSLGALVLLGSAAGQPTIMDLAYWKSWKELVSAKRYMRIVYLSRAEGEVGDEELERMLTSIIGIEI
jgi:hypothetical protein